VGDTMNTFEDRVKDNLARLHGDRDLHALARLWTRMTNSYDYTYNFSWLGRPIIQYPQDIMAM
jgi:cephalosporin hydroxylase